MFNRVLKFLVIVLLFSIRTVAQSTYLPQGSDDYHTLDRLEIRSGRLDNQLRMTNKLVQRSTAIGYIDQKLKDSTLRLTQKDHYNLEQMISESGEWPYNGDREKNSRSNLWNVFYVKQYDDIHIKTDDLFCVINPVANLMVTANSETPKPAGSKSLLSLNQHGAEMRARITDKLGFYTLLTDNQEYTPGFLTKYAVGKQRVFPGQDYFLFSSAAGYGDYFYASGYFDFALVKNHINITAGQGNNFIGDGIRSLFLGDNGPGYPYIKITTHWGRFNYQNLFMQLTPTFQVLNTTLHQSFANINHLDINLARWLNIGLFEGILYGNIHNTAIDEFDPVIYTHLPSNVGGDKAKELVGFNFKALAAHHFEFYGQVLLDAFNSPPLSQVAAKNNRFGIQFGGKYADALGIRNLDLQGEINAVRPFTYSSSDTTVSYTNYDQALADPLGSGFVEMIGTARYQASKKVVISLRGAYYTRGADTGKLTYGNNIFSNDYFTASNLQEGWTNGVTSSCLMAGANISYQIFPNLFIDLGGVKRRYTAGSTKPLYTSTGESMGSDSETWLYFGVRINAPRRAYDVYY